ncbi:MAG: hypothetical protein KAT11_06845 [Phycisphaerae bacterium]|nr:hypothetical protein [Phycisphaerae bacterium]
MAQGEYASAAGAYVEAMRTVRGAKNLFFGLLVVVILFLVAAFCLVQYAGVLEGESEPFWDNWLNWAFPFSAFVGVVVGCLYVLTLLVGLKISLAGRLEGAAGLTKGFFWSLLFLAIFLPWQNILVHKVAGEEVPMLHTVPGVLYGLGELKQKTAVKVQEPKEARKSKPKDAVEEDEGTKVDVPKEARLAIRFILYPIAALLLLVAAQSKYRPQRVEMPEPVSISRLTEQPAETPQ